MSEPDYQRHDSWCRYAAHFTCCGNKDESTDCDCEIGSLNRQLDALRAEMTQAVAEAYDAGVDSGYKDGYEAAWDEANEADRERSERE